MVDAVLLFDPAARLDPPHDRVAIGERQGRVRGDVVQGVAVGKQSAALGTARMLTRERNLLRIDHVLIVRSGIRSAPRGW